jgi:hypothetical protein
MNAADRKALERWAENLTEANDGQLKRTAADTLAVLRSTLSQASSREDDKQFIERIVDPLIAELRRRAAVDDLPDITPRGRC